MLAYSCSAMNDDGFHVFCGQGGWGTENYIIPLGAGYIEIAAVWDPEAAQSCDWGKCGSGMPCIRRTLLSLGCAALCSAASRTVRMCTLLLEP